MPLDPARVLSAYLRAQVYRAPEPGPEHTSAGGEQPPAAAPDPQNPSDPPGSPGAAHPAHRGEERPPASPDAPVAEAGPAAPRGAPRRPGLFARLRLYVRQE
ncbi:hypothetical protein [Streptomyces nondiastaticus]|uniref:Uncharacterized protein n=1 Tax=Streptomyces nondiastaticus TaxID=3154512 RepID=A0ABW6U1J5_9ACTN